MNELELKSIGLEEMTKKEQSETDGGFWEIVIITNLIFLAATATEAY